MRIWHAVQEAGSELASSFWTQNTLPRIGESAPSPNQELTLRGPAVKSEFWERSRVGGGMVNYM